jgi:uncharacterized protein
LGICAPGGYVPFAAETDRRIKAIGTVSPVDLGDMVRKGQTALSTTWSTCLRSLTMFGIEEAKGQSPRLEHIVPNTPEEVPENAISSIREATDYYRTPRGQHPNSQNLIYIINILTNLHIVIPKWIEIAKLCSTFYFFRNIIIDSI